MIRFKTALFRHSLPYAGNAMEINPPNLDMTWRMREVIPLTPFQPDRTYFGTSDPNARCFPGSMCEYECLVIWEKQEAE